MKGYLDGSEKSPHFHHFENIMTTKKKRLIIQERCMEARHQTVHQQRTQLEVRMAELLDERGLHYWEQVRVSPERKFRFDFVVGIGGDDIILSKRFVGIEVHGGTNLKRGGHNTHAGIISDLTKILYSHEAGIEYLACVLQTKNTDDANIHRIADYVATLK